MPRLYDEFDRFAAATAGKEVRGEIAPGFENTFRYSLLDPEADVAAEAAAVPAGLRPPRAAAPGPERRRCRAVEAEKGSPLDERERQILDERIDAARGWLASYAPERARIVVRRDALPDAAADLDDTQRRYLAAAWPRPSRPRRHGPVTPGRTRSSPRPPSRARGEAGVRGDLPRVPRPAERAAAGWLLASLDPVS